MSDTPLARKLRLLIDANGPMTIADFMALCLGDPAHGYYMTRDPLGAGGDFVTAPEVSQMFGEIVGAWLVEAWQLGGSPSPVHLVELGPGRGTMMGDILRVARRIPEFWRAIAVHLVETSTPLRERQAATLARTGAEIRWHPTFGAVPEGPLLLVANEFFDALPIRQFVASGGTWRERVVGLDADGRLAFGRGVGGISFPYAEETEDGAVLEVCPAGEALAAGIAERIVDSGGAALVIDYGHGETAFGETLQALRGHRFADPLAKPGEADLTAHVDFAALARSAGAAGAIAHGPITQRDFLLSLGLLQRASRLGENADGAAREALQAAVERLTAPSQMGTLFKVMALTRSGLRPAPFHQSGSEPVPLGS